MTKVLTMRLIPALMMAGFAGVASASGFQLTEQNASGLGNAYAGSAAVAENASTIFFNPAGMTQLQAREFSVGVTAIKTSFKFNNEGSSVGGFASAGNGNDGGTLGFVPNGYISWALTKDLYLGLGIGAPFGLKTEYDNPWVGAAQAVSFDVKTYNLNPSVAYRVNDKVSLGAGLNWQKIDATYIRQAGIGAGTSTAVRSTMSLDDMALGWNAGALFTLSPSTKVGVSYRSKVKYHTEGDVQLSNDGTAGGIGTMAAFVAAGAQSNVKADITLPDMLILSASQKLSDRWDMLGDISWTGWSSIPKIDIIRTSGVANGAVAQTLDTNFRNTWRVALGANYKVNDAWKAKFGIAYDQTPVQNAETRLTSLPDNNRFWLSLGAQWVPSKGSTVDFGVTRLFLKDAKINNDQTTGQAVARGVVNGTYNDSAWLLGAQYSMSF